MSLKLTFPRSTWFVICRTLWMSMKNNRKFDHQEVGEIFEQGIRLRDSGRLREAIAKFYEILKLNTEYNGPVFGVLGNIYWDLNDYSNALTCYQKAVTLKPTSELASLGLFHTLWRLER